jgi:hypothetical protein
MRYAAFVALHDVRIAIVAMQHLFSIGLISQNVFQ